MTTINRLHSSSQTYPQLSQYVTLLQLRMTQVGSLDLLGVSLKLTLEQEKAISREGFPATT